MVRFSELFKNVRKTGSHHPKKHLDDLLTPATDKQEEIPNDKKDRPSHPQISDKKEIEKSPSEIITKPIQKESASPEIIIADESKKQGPETLSKANQSGVLPNIPSAIKEQSSKEINPVNQFERPPEPSPTTVCREPIRPETPAQADIPRKENNEQPLIANKLYDQLGDIIFRINREANISKDVFQLNYSELALSLDKTLNMVITGNRALLDMIHQVHGFNYLKSHLVNTGILSLYLGHRLNYDRPKLMEIGILAFLHEIPCKLPAEFQGNEDIDSVSHDSLIVLRKTQYLANMLLSSFRQQNTNLSQKECTVETDSKDIMDYIQIINIADIYETLCRPKASLKKKDSHLVMKDLIASQKILNKDVLKALINLVGIYPVGSLVKLSTEEIAQVVGINENHPLRPVVHIIYDPNKQRLSKPRISDLNANMLIFITGIVSENGLTDIG